MNHSWDAASVSFLRGLQDTGTGMAQSTPKGPITLYGSCYLNLALGYLNAKIQSYDELLKNVVSFQDDVSGLFVGPELIGFKAPEGILHDREHLLMHLTCAVVPLCQEYS
ncbi:MAG: hypothetical protein NWR03_12925, partial [Akkermansiaceae bacterium]|nr:hypothetical protein [Akkermansiaceae bacterium]